MADLNLTAPFPDADGLVRSISLDGEWRFVRDPGRRIAATRLPEGEPIQVPGCWEAQVSQPFGVLHAWYHRSFVAPAHWRGGGQLMVRFGAVMYRCEVWLNGARVGEHEGGYTPFDVVLNGVRWGSDNVLAVLVTNPMNALGEYPALSRHRIKAAERVVPELLISEIPHGKQTWYGSQSGLWRSVAVELRPDPHLRDLGVVATWSTGGVDVTAGVCGRLKPETHIAVRVIDPRGETAASQTMALDRAGSIRAHLDVADQQGWDIGKPVLYQLEASLIVGGKVIHKTVTRFGFREIRSEDGRILLNGRPILLRGALDQDLYDETISMHPSRELLDRQMRLAHEMGLNLLRLHIKSPDAAYLDAADEAGLLLWCELPNWLRLTPDSAARGEETLKELVKLVGSHPSVVIWTIINEDWGTDLRGSSADRRWLRRTAARLRELDETRLVVDNSACPTSSGPNFHLDTDIADFHRYAAMPDAAQRWSAQMAELAERPDWLWSPHGDAVRRGNEPVVVSEFGNWSLPDLRRFGDPWWAHTGDGPARPSGAEARFARQRLERIWPDLGALSIATQRLQFDALQFEAGEIRRHPGMAGLVVTEFTDANWEPNGLLELDRRPKAEHTRMAEIFGPAMLVPRPIRRDLWGGEAIEVPITLSSESAGSGGVLRWRLGGTAGSVDVGPWGAASSTPLPTLSVAVPVVDQTTDAELVTELLDRDGTLVARSSLGCAVIPARLRRSPMPESAAQEPRRLVVTPGIDDELLAFVNSGGHALVLARSEEAIAPALALERPVGVLPRWPAPDRGRLNSTWTGDWISAFSWIAPDFSPELPFRAPLDFVFGEVLPDHVLTGYNPSRHAAEVAAGMFVGWIHAPVALIWSFRQGDGRVTLTTFHVAPERGPVATTLRNALLQLADRD